MDDSNLRDGVFSYGSSTFKIRDLEQFMEEFLKDSMVKNGFNDFLAKRGCPPLNNRSFVGHGDRGSVLIPGNTKWLNGLVKLRVKLEFIPDVETVVQEEQKSPPESIETFSVLDDIRKGIEA